MELSSEERLYYTRNVAPLCEAIAERKGLKVLSGTFRIFGEEASEVNKLVEENTAEFYAKTPCKVAMFVAFIDEKGDVYPCTNTPYRRPDLCLGNVKQNSFTEIWRGAGSAYARKVCRGGPQCHTCSSSYVDFNELASSLVTIGGT